MQKWMGVVVGFGLLVGSQAAEAAYTTKSLGVYIVPWGTTVTKTKRCPQTDVEGLGGTLIRYIDGRASFIALPDMTGVTISDRKDLNNGHRATFSNFSEVPRLPGFHMSMVFQVTVRCRYKTPPNLTEEDIELFTHETGELDLSLDEGQKD